MSGQPGDVDSTRGTPKGPQLGFFFSRTQTPLQTRFKKPEAISPHLSTIANLKREDALGLTSPMLYRLAFSHTTPTYPTQSANRLKPLKNNEKSVEKATEACGIIDQTIKFDGMDKVTSEVCVNEQVYQTEGIPLACSAETWGTDSCKPIRPQAYKPPESLTAYLDVLDKQVIVEDGIEDKQTPNPKYPNPRKPHLLFPAFESSRKEPQMSSSAQSIPVKTNTASVGSRCHTNSVCSCCSSEDFVGQSRCSVCDGSSTTSSCRLRATGSDSGFLEHVDSLLGSDVRLGGMPYGCQDLYGGNSDLHRHVFGNEEFKSSSGKCSCFASRGDSSGQHSRNSSGDSSVDKRNKTVSLTKDQLMFLLQRVELSRFREIVVDKLADHERLSQSQRRTIACLIQAVVLVNKRLHSQTDKWLKLQADIRQLQMEKKVHQRRHRRVTVCMCALLCLYLLNFHGVRNRLMSIIRYFGIVETVEKVNRTRRMVSDNWRNIPSLLTNFWRIFIFRSKSKLARQPPDY